MIAQTRCPACFFRMFGLNGFQEAHFSRHHLLFKTILFAVFLFIT